ncbi:MAG: DNA-processing protein DprA [Methylocella sp.]
MALTLTHAQRRDWLRLSLSENVGPVTFRQLIERFGDASTAIAALPELSRKGGMARPLRLYGEGEAEGDLERGEDLGASAVVPGEKQYPELLRHIDAAPPVLWIKGRGDFANGSCVAIVGARNASALGFKFARTLASEIGQAGHLIVSGLARGIDTAAHEAALASGTIAALAGGLDSIYPPENAKLQAEIGERGLLVSEMKPGTIPRAELFPRRNRIISGMARATIVMEAALPSGSLITARFAAEQGREVFAVPGSPLDPRAEGTNRLIRDGATLVTCSADILEILNVKFTPANGMFLEPERGFEQPAAVNESDRRKVLELLSPSPIDLDDLIRESRLAPSAAAGILLELELAGLALRHPRGAVSLRVA